MLVLLTTLAAFTAALLLAGIVYQWTGSGRDLRRYPAPGQLVDVGGRRLHVHSMGEGSPAVIFEAGIAATSLSWSLVQPEVAKFTRAIVYDRAGLGWSDPSPSPGSLNNILRDLAAVIEKSGVREPIILVGHSFGGLVALEYACGNPSKIAGLVLVDALAAAEWCPVTPEAAAALARGVLLSRRGAWLARIGVVRLSLALLQAGSRRMPKLAARLSAGSASKVTERLVGEIRKLPRELWPAVQAHWCLTNSFHSMADHLESLPANAKACRADCDLGDVPIVVLSAADTHGQRASEHARIAKLSSQGTRIVAAGSGHWIQLDRPELVIQALQNVVESTRSRVANNGD